MRIVAAFVLVGLLGVAETVVAQTPVLWQVDPVQSMVWWQVNPHFGHLWATTCPNDDTWQAGEGRSTQYRGQARIERKVRQTNVKESGDQIPLFPRDTVRANCKRAIAGEITQPSGDSYRGVRGAVRVRADSLVIGSDMRDAFARRYIYKSGLYKEIAFTIDSMTTSATQGDTVRGVAYGVFQLRDGKQSVAVPFKAWDEPAGRRVRGKWFITAPQLTEDFHVPKGYLAMGVASKLWDELHMGFDLILRRSGGAGDPPSAAGSSK